MPPAPLKPRQARLDVAAAPMCASLGIAQAQHSEQLRGLARLSARRRTWLART
jgi:hypothetical protein